jgi:hypothetical protein
MSVHEFLRAQIEPEQLSIENGADELFPRNNARRKELGENE